MALVEFRLDHRDRETYGLPEWLPFDLVELDDLPYSTSGAWDRELKRATGVGIRGLLSIALLRGEADGIVAMIWLAAKMAGVPTPGFKDFDIRWRLIEERDPRKAKKGKTTAGDADPPPSGSSEPPSA